MLGSPAGLVGITYFQSRPYIQVALLDVLAVALEYQCNGGLPRLVTVKAPFRGRCQGYKYPGSEAPSLPYHEKDEQLYTRTFQ